MRLTGQRVHYDHGDAVEFQQSVKGGYGYDYWVPATFLRYTAKRAQIRIQVRDGSTVEVFVHPRYLIGRVKR